MQFRVAAGQPGDVAGWIGRLVGQRRERHDLRACCAPALQQMRIDKRERNVPGQRNALSRRRDASRGIRSARDSRRACRCFQRCEVDVALDQIGQRRQPVRERGILLRLDQPEVPLRHRQGIVAVDRTENLNADPRKSIAHQRRMPVARDLVEDHAGNIDVLAIARKAERDGGGRLRLARDIDYQHDGPPGRGGDIGGRAVAPGPSQGDAVEQSHHAFGEREIGIIGKRPAAHRSGRAPAPMNPG